jgi:hypothetical protein
MKKVKETRVERLFARYAAIGQGYAGQKIEGETTRQSGQTEKPVLIVKRLKEVKSILGK